MALVQVNVLANVPDTEDASRVAVEFVFALRERYAAQVYDATFTVIAEGGERLNLEEMAAELIIDEGSDGS